MTVLTTMMSDAISQTVFSRLRKAGPFLVLLSVICLASSELVAAGNAKVIAAIDQSYQEEQAKFVQQVESEALKCEQQGLEELAEELRLWEVPFQRQTGNINSLPSQVQPKIPADLPVAERTARETLREIRQEYARKLFLLAKKSQKEKYSSFAYHCVQEVLHLDPDHTAARGLLGYQLIHGEWVTPFAAEKKRKAEVWDARWGWIEEKNIPRYEAGERLYNGKWITADQETKLRANFKTGWDISTEHFQVKTNHSQEKGVELATHAEAFHDYFMNQFAAFFQTPQQLEKLFEGGAVKQDKALHKISFFRTQEEFVEAITKQCPVARQIQGFYSNSDRKAYFYYNPVAEPEAAMETLVHEVTHQLLSESSLQAVPVGHERDFWVVEGLACYLESFRLSPEGQVSVGDAEHPRILAARQLVADGSYETLERFTARGMKAFQVGAPKELQDRYAQSTGLTHFFLHFQNGLYQDGFIEFMSQLYSPDRRIRDRAKPIHEVLGVSARVLDEQYVAYIKALNNPQ